VQDGDDVVLFVWLGSKLFLELVDVVNNPFLDGRPDLFLLAFEKGS
jgi:hypothetical protein